MRMAHRYADLSVIRCICAETLLGCGSIDLKGGQPTFAGGVGYPSCQVGSRHSNHAELGPGAAPLQGGVELYVDPETRTAEVNRRTICIFRGRPVKDNRLLPAVAGLARRGTGIIKQRCAGIKRQHRQL